MRTKDLCGLAALPLDHLSTSTSQTPRAKTLQCLAPATVPVRGSDVQPQLDPLSTASQLLQAPPNRKDLGKFDLDECVGMVFTPDTPQAIADFTCRDEVRDSVHYQRHQVGRSVFGSLLNAIQTP